MATFTFSFGTSGFPTTFVDDLAAFKDAFAASLTASISTDNLLTGKIGGSAPTSDIGPWFDVSGGYVWKRWNGSAYVPIDLKLGNGSFNLTLVAGTLTANRTVLFQNDDGTVAYLDDVYNKRTTVVITGTTPNVDWSASETFFYSLTANRTFTMSNSLPSQEIALAVSATGAFTITWPTDVVWAGGTPPAQTSTATDVYIFTNIGGTIYGRREIANAS
jgi:hypothetical protein